MNLHQCRLVQTQLVAAAGILARMEDLNDLLAALDRQEDLVKSPHPLGDHAFPFRPEDREKLRDLARAAEPLQRQARALLAGGRRG